MEIIWYRILDSKHRVILLIDNDLLYRPRIRIVMTTWYT